MAKLAFITLFQHIFSGYVALLRLETFISLVDCEGLVPLFPSYNDARSLADGISERSPLVIELIQGTQAIQLSDQAWFSRQDHLADTKS